MLPAALPVPSNITAVRIRVAWAAMMMLVVAVQLAGFAYVLFDTYRIKPATQALGFVIDFEDDSAVVTPQRSDLAAAGVRPGAQIVTIANRSFRPSSSEFTLARAVMATAGDVVPLTFRNPDGKVVAARISRSSHAALLAPAPPLSVNVRMAVRLSFTLLCSLALLGSSLLLLRHRPNDPEAILLGLGFLGIAASVDPPLLLWLAIGAGWMIDVVTSLWWTLVVVALAAFPDGRFTPLGLRWTLIGAPLIGIFLASDWLGDILSLLVGIGVPLALLAAQVVRFRRLDAGLKRQQIKWAALGFTAGFILAGLALGMSLSPYDNWSAQIRAAWVLATVCLFNLGFAVLPLGLMVSLVRFRLWDVDRVITRSAALTLLTGAIALLWALLSDIAKQIIAVLMGQEHGTAAVAIGAVIAVGVFAPTQRLVMTWSKQRFNRPRLDLEALPKRIETWREQFPASEVAARVLDVAVRALHAPAGAVLVRTPTDRKLLASRWTDEQEGSIPFYSPAEARKGQIFHLEDEDGLAGWLILSPRLDGSHYASSDLAMLAEAAGPLTKALRPAPPGDRPSEVLGVLDEVQRRLAELEQRTRARPKSI